MWMVLAWAVMVPLGWAVAGAPVLPVPGGLPDALAAYWSSAVQRVPVVWGWLAVAGALGVVAVGRSRVAATHVSTVAHEFGHALVAALFGGRVTAIRMSLTGSGTAHNLLVGSVHRTSKDAEYWTQALVTDL